MYDERRHYDEIETAKMIGREEGIAEGIGKGIDKGERIRARKIAAKLMAKGMTKAEAAEFVGLTETELDAEE